MSYYKPPEAHADDYARRIECECEDCGRTFDKGDQGDNERFCLRCEARYAADRELDEEMTPCV